MEFTIDFGTLAAEGYLIVKKLLQNSITVAIFRVSLGVLHCYIFRLNFKRNPLFCSVVGVQKRYDVKKVQF